MDTVQDWSELGERVREARVAAQLSQGVLAKELGIDRTALVRVEAGERGVSALELTRLAEKLSVPISYLVYRSSADLVAYRSLLADAPDEAPDEDADRTRFALDVALEEHAKSAKTLLDFGYLQASSLFKEQPASDVEEAVAAASHLRALLGIGTEPVGPIVDTAEAFGLYIKVATDSQTGASLQLDPGFGVAIVGQRADPGRRRWTAVHELGHHIFGDKYSSDAGVATSERDRERLIDAFASEFLLPESKLKTLPSALTLDALRVELVKLSGTYRLSWSSTINAAKRCGRVDAREAQRLRAASPTGGDFIHLLGREPAQDLLPSSTGPAWQRAVLDAYLARRITGRRAVSLLADALSVEDLPQREFLEFE